MPGKPDEAGNVTEEEASGDEAATEEKTKEQPIESESVAEEEASGDAAITEEKTPEQPIESESVAEEEASGDEAATEEKTPEQPIEAAGMTEKEASGNTETAEEEKTEEAGGGTEKAEEAAASDGNKTDDAAPDGDEEIEQDGYDTWEEQEDWEDEADAQSTKPWMMVLVFLGLIAAAAVICVVLWKSTHADKSGEGQMGMFGEGALWTGTTAPDGGTGNGASTMPGAAQTQGASENATTQPEPENTPDPDRVVTQDGRTIIFTKCDDVISPKEYVNLRTEPSTSQGNATVSCRLNYGEKAHRTGYSDDMGWSRVEYNDQVLYVVTSYVVVVTDAAE